MSGFGSSQIADSLSIVITGANGKIKNVRFIKPFGNFSFEFKANSLYINLINKGHIKPNTWKIPFVFGIWLVNKKEK